MDKYQKAICDYEKWRQVVADYSKERSDLVVDCKIFNAKINEGWQYINGDNIPNCLILAYQENLEMNRDNGEMYAFDEVLSEGVAAGKYCQNCLDAHRIKVKKLGPARQQFGIAKRRLSTMGKALIKTDAAPTEH